ncbi:MAG TPA: type II toxin-antitoxin system prevent-host-death family antitoxin [Acidobacteriaceae bacterium]|nr:type II toxin-antitoxin system prevent-host-death family antitoxin [Acidobacteriaceae bacterium]
MIEIASFEARDKFSRLLDRVQLGEEIIITRRGKAVAKIVPEGSAPVEVLAGDVSTWAPASEEKETQAATSNSH